VLCYLRFIPERFLAENAKSRSPLAHVPFGFGQRKCPGFRFSRCEAYVFLSVVIPKYNE